MATSVPAVSDAAQYGEEFASMEDVFQTRARLVVDRDHEVLWCCELAPKVLRRPMPLTLTDGKLAIADDELRSELVEFLGNVGTDVEHKLVRAKAKPHWLLLRAWKPSGSKRAVRLLCSPSYPIRDVVESGLAAELKLTRAEIRVLQEFAELRSPKDIARALDVSLSTVRGHLKAIHAKAFVTTSLQLLRLIYTFCSG